jgi:Leucine-rich repeat (LRR) protein
VPAWYGRLTKLRTLDLGHNALMSVPDLDALTQLEILYLHDNALTQLPALPPSLRYLNVSENPLRDVVLGELPALIELRLLELGLTELVLPPLPALRELHLRTNALTAVPETVRGLHELSVPDWLVELPRLEKLDLRWNEVYDPPRELVDRGCVVLCE